MAAGKERSEASKRTASVEIAAATRGAPKSATMVLPVWGYRYVRQFLELSLSTLLAPGNVPAVAAALPCRFVILTSAEDEAFIREHPHFRLLGGICETAIDRIDHLITGSNHSTTITLAYTEQVRAAGEAMLDTCFFFLVSDYIMADGSLAGVLERMLAGESAVQVGNFQVVEEEALPWLKGKQRARGALSLQPREMMAWALGHIHPTATANMVNFPFAHNSHTNRLFWRVDADTLIGRFYLMHMICVRPEVTDFVIGASCDYSFVPEMCPSGRIAAITDSDAYLVIEMQPLAHESQFLRAGPVEPKRLARSLSEWTTAHHRANADHTIVFHAGDRPDTLQSCIETADAFVDRVRSALSAKPQPVRGHPYWRGAVAAFREATGKRLGEDEWRYVFGAPGRYSRFLDDLRFAVFGRPPHVKPWHPSWPDYRVLLRALAGFFDDPRRRLLIVSDVPTVFTVALADNGERVVRLQLTPILRSAADRYDPFHQRFDLCLLELAEHELERTDRLLDRIAGLVKPDGAILVSVVSKRSIGELGEFLESISFHMPLLVRPSTWPDGIQFVRAGRIRSAAQRALVMIAKLAYSAPAIGFPILAALGPILTVFNLAGNLAAARVKTEMPGHGRFSSCLIRLSVAVGAGAGEGERRGDAEPMPIGTDDATREPQYMRCVEVRDEIGLTPLGLMANQVWHDDPRRLGFVLARYKFVAKMLSGRRDVGELGCGDAFGSRIVLQEVDRLAVYDFDPLFIDDVRARMSERWPFDASVHDIITGPLPRRHDGLYSLDVIEHIPREDEHAYLDNLCASLTDDGVLIIGTPSLESQSYASAISKAGHVNCKGGKELKALLEQYFSTVAVFSMNDEVVHTGFYPMAHYLFAMCTGKRRPEASTGPDGE